MSRKSCRHPGNSKPLLGLLLASIASPAIAAEDSPGAWITFSISDAVSSAGQDTRWHYWFDTQARFFDPGSGASQYLVRPGFGYRFSNGVKGWIGYARYRTRGSNGTVVHENRYWQQADWSAGSLFGGNLSLRARLEERSLSVGEDVAVRFRFSGKYVRPLDETGRRSLIVGIEPFFDLRDTDFGSESGLSQNRAFFGMGWRVGESLTLEAGYMNQWIRVGGGPDRVFHHGVMNFNVRL
ncbi:MAG: DUF2490 domain-containing protein [Woeseiaceae bacterium]|nr:DUF2490 domain-containing protein [Woeseiaceae bacterium]